MLHTYLNYHDIYVVVDRLQVIDPNYRSYFQSVVEDDGEKITKKRKKNDQVVGAPNEVDWENAR